MQCAFSHRGLGCGRSPSQHEDDGHVHRGLHRSRGEPRTGQREAAFVVLELVLIGRQSMNHPAISQDHHQLDALGRIPPEKARTGTNNMVDDSTRFANIVLPHLDDAYALAGWLTDNAVDAEDVVQDACLHILRNIKRFAGDNARAWLLTIVRQRAHLQRKDHSAAVASVGDSHIVEPAPSIAGDFETPESALIAKADRVRLQAAMAALPSPFLETVMLREVQGLSYHQIAEIIEVPIGTVMSRLARGRHLLISAFETADS